MNKKILIVGLARNCSEVIFENIRTLKYAFSGHSVQFLVIESDSSDETVSELKKIKQKITDFEFISLGSLSDQFPLRTDRIAQCRNAYLSEINTNPKYSSIDFVVMADLDGVNQLLTPHAIASCWTRDDWDVCTANQKYAYYDIFALRHPLWSPNDCLKHYNFLRQYNVNKEKALYIAIHSKMLTIPKNSEWIEVDSAFGGLGIYKKNILSNLVYTGLDNDGNEICEHVPFHFCGILNKSISPS